MTAKLRKKTLKKHILSNRSTNSENSQAKNCDSSESEDESENEKSVYSESLEEFTDTTKRRSWIWEHFKIFSVTKKFKDGRVKTEKRVCSQIEDCKHYYKYSGSTSRCSTHLVKIHKISENASATNNQLPKANEHERDYFNELLLMFIITAGNSKY